MIGQFFSLTPDAVLHAVEQAGQHTTGLCYPLNSLENRVYEVELDDGQRVVAKFYRPGRHSQAAIEDEHRLLAALAEMEIPVCAPRLFPSGRTLESTSDNIHFAVFPRTGGRCPDELDETDLTQLGRLVGRIHNVSASLVLKHRPELSAQTYGLDCLNTLLAKDSIALSVQQAYSDAVNMLVKLTDDLAKNLETFVVHGDCHKGNLLRGRSGWFFLDFDDMASSYAIQDMWLLLSARPSDCPREVEAFMTGYEQFRSIDPRSIKLVEALRGLRYVRYAAWIASRWDDPSFPRAFPDWGNEVYWQRQLNDLYEQLRIINTPEYY